MDPKTAELKHRVEAKRKELEARLDEVKADAAAKGAETEADLRKRLDDLQNAVKGGWEDLSDEAVDRINSLLKSN